MYYMRTARDTSETANPPSMACVAYRVSSRFRAGKISGGPKKHGMVYHRPDHLMVYHGGKPKGIYHYGILALRKDNKRVPPWHTPYGIPWWRTTALLYTFFGHYRHLMQQDPPSSTRRTPGHMVYHRMCSF